MKRLRRPIALAAASAALLSGCMLTNDQGTSNTYTPADGMNTDLADGIGIRNALVVTSVPDVSPGSSHSGDHSEDGSHGYAANPTTTESAAATGTASATETSSSGTATTTSTATSSESATDAAKPSEEQTPTDGEQKTGALIATVFNNTDEEATVLMMGEGFQAAIKVPANDNVKISPLEETNITVSPLSARPGEMLPLQSGLESGGGQGVQWEIPVLSTDLPRYKTLTPAPATPTGTATTAPGATDTSTATGTGTGTATATETSQESATEPPEGSATSTPAAEPTTTATP